MVPPHDKYVFQEKLSVRRGSAGARSPRALPGAKICRSFRALIFNLFK